MTNKGKQSVETDEQVAPSDPFILEQVYPDPAGLFRISKLPAVSNQSVIVALDTNALLLPYRINPGNMQKLGEVYKTLASEKRLFVPGRAAREFARHRDTKLSELIQSLNRRKSEFPGAEIPPLLEGMAGYSEMKAAYEEICASRVRFQKAMDLLIGQMKNWRGDDPVSVVYSCVFTEDAVVDLPYDEADKTAYISEMRNRYRHHIPPGYKDASKEDGGIGDFLIWKTLLILGQREQKDMVFVTGDQKADWFVQSGGGPVYPRQELLDEYRRASKGRTFRIMGLHELLEEMRVPDAVVKDVKTAEAEVRAEENNRDRKRAIAADCSASLARWWSTDSAMSEATRIRDEQSLKHLIFTLTQPNKKDDEEKFKRLLVEFLVRRKTESGEREEEEEQEDTSPPDPPTE